MKTDELPEGVLLLAGEEEEEEQEEEEEEEEADEGEEASRGRLGRRQAHPNPRVGAVVVVAGRRRKARRGTGRRSVGRRSRTGA